MTKDEIIYIINNSNSRNDFSLSDFYDLKNIANVSLKINEETNSYFYKVKIDDLADKDFDEKIISEYNWKLSEDGNFIVLYI